MMKLLTVIGARPQIIKSAALSRTIRAHFAARIQEVIVHTGQHYDPLMSGNFFDELGIPQPGYNLQVGSGPHGEQTARMLTGLEAVILTEQPDYLIVYGDTNSTLAGALAAAKMHVPIVHIEAGLRSFNKRMPEEINRILSDHVATFLFPPTPTGYENLRREGFRPGAEPPYTIDNPGVFMVGDIMLDNSLYFAQVARTRSTVLTQNNLEPGAYVLITLHRNANTDDPARLNAIFGALIELANSRSVRVVMPLHPRTRKQMAALLDPALHRAIETHPNLSLLPPVAFLDMIQLEQHAQLIITDSGGVQKEAYFFRKPCLILRPETEWVEMVEHGAARLCDADPGRILAGYEAFCKGVPPALPANLYGDGRAAEAILNCLLGSLAGATYQKDKKGPVLVPPVAVLSEKNT